MMFGIEVFMLKIIIIRTGTCFGVEINHNHGRCTVVKKSKKCNE